jgi:hypothetical protein
LVDQVCSRSCKSDSNFACKYIRFSGFRLLARMWDFLSTRILGLNRILFAGFHWDFDSGMDLNDLCVFLQIIEFVW